MFSFRNLGPAYRRLVPAPYTIKEACGVEKLGWSGESCPLRARVQQGVLRLLIFLGGSGRGYPLLRASNEHILIVRVLRARRAPGRSLLILLLQSAVEGVPREALEREGACFLSCPDW
jgi:hypothetical protein